MEEPTQTSLAVKYVRSTSLGWVRIILVRGTQLVYLFFMARWLTQSQMGHVQAMALGLTFITGVVTPWIAWTLQQRTIAARDPESAIRVAHQLSVYGFISTFLFAPLISLIYLSTIQVPIISGEGLLFLSTALAVCIIVLLRRVYLAFLKIEMDVVVDAIRMIANYLIPMALFFLFQDVIMVFWGWLAADLLVLIIIIPTCGLRRDLSLYRPEVPSKDLVIFAMPLFFIYLMRSFRSFVDRFIVMIFFGEANLATYHLVIRITSIVSQAVLTLLISFLPIMMKIFEERPHRAGVALGATMKMLFHALLFVAPLLAFCGAPIINLILGDQYTTIESCLILSAASLSMVLSAFITFFTNIRGAKGDTHKMLLFELSSLVGCIISLILFALTGWIQTAQSIGVALAMAFGSFLSFSFIAWQTKELSLLGKSILRLLLLIPPHALFVLLLSTLLLPLDLLDLAVVAGASLLFLLLMSALTSSFTSEELEVLSRAFKGRLDPLIKTYQRLGVRRAKKEGRKPP